jgi:inhibitor of cysteine peptidase
LQRLSSLSDRTIYAVFIGIGLSLFAFIFMLATHYNPFARSDMDYNYQTGIPIGNIFADIGKGPFDSDQQMKKFSSYSELKGFLQDVRGYFAKVYREQNYGSSDLYFSQSVAQAQGSGTPMLSSPFSGFFGRSMYTTNTQSESRQLTAADPSAAFREAGLINNDFSGTNIQVAGVDEADFLKTDGKYAYLISGSRLTIVDAYPPENAKIVSKAVLDIPEGQGLQNMFLSGDRLAIFYQGYSDRTIIPEYTYAPVNVYEAKTHVLVIDISDRENPKVLKNYEVGGQYSNSRMLGTKIFLLTSSGVDHDNPVVPSVQETSKVVASPDVYYFDNPEESYTFNTVTAIDLEAIGDTDKALLSKTFMIGPGSTVYVSENNIYIAYQQNLPYDHLQASNSERFFKVIVPLLPANVQNQIKSIEQDQSLDATQKWNNVSALLRDTYNNLSKSEQAELFSKVQRGVAEYDSMIAKQSQKTILHKISISGDTMVNYVAKGEVPGRLLNQFSMDEHNGKFRIATTSEYSTPQRFVMNNNVYTLDSQMNIVGKLEGIAPDESIYSALFIGDRLYLVTFQRIDPFFVIDLSKDQPEVLGKLKLPGFSNYLHPYDKDHIIGIGKETSDNGAQILGVKMALFDVSDENNPMAVDTYLIGGLQTESEALNDHKAFLFDKEKNILVIPIFSPETYSLSGGSKGTGPHIEPRMWNGFFAFGINSEKQFELKGLVEHEASNHYGSQGSRSFYINDTLYTITPTLMKMTNLEDMEEINQIHLERTGQIMDYLE